MSKSPEVEQQPWAEAVIECVSDKAERERLIRHYTYDELVQACLLLGTFTLSLKRDRRTLEAETEELAAVLRVFAYEIAGIGDLDDAALDRMRDEPGTAGELVPALLKARSLLARHAARAEGGK